MKIKFFVLAVMSGVVAFNAGAWDYEGHHAINEMALASLPKDFGGFELTPALKGRIEYLAGEPDRWRNVPNRRNGTGLALAQYNETDHYIGMEDLKLYDLTPETLPPLRYDFAADIVKARAAHPERFLAIDPDKDADHSRELDGFLPWAITENYEKLKSDFGSLWAFMQHGGTPEEIANAKADCIYVMGVMGHYVGDGSQPLHTTVHFNGWVGDNPKGYTTKQSFHAWIDGGYFKKNGGIKADALVGKIQTATRIANAEQPDGVFRAVVDYLVEQNKFVEPLYEMEKNGQLTGEDGKGMDGVPFLDGQLVKAGQMLGNLWLTAWLEAPEDAYLERQLQQRATANAEAK
jgi:hypothetical protein